MQRCPLPKVSTPLPRRPLYHIHRGFSVYDWNRPGPCPGVYMIRCLVNGKCYVGASRNLEKRFDGYMPSSNGELKADFKRYGRAKFLVTPLLYLLDDMMPLELYEASLILAYDTIAPNGYNVRSSAQYGLNSPVHRKMMSDIIRGWWVDPDYRERTMRGRKKARLKTNESLRKAWQRDHDARVADMRTIEHRTKLAEAQHRRHEDPNEGAKLSASQTRRWSDPALRAAQSQRLKDYHANKKGL